VRPASKESTADPDRVIGAALRCVPTSARLAILGELHVKDLGVSDFIRLRTSRPKSAASAKLADAEMKCWSGCRPRYHAGKRLDANSLLPCLGGTNSISRSISPHSNPLQLLGNLPMQTRRFISGMRVAGEVN
jgi:hypothetical protein